MKKIEDGPATKEEWPEVAWPERRSLEEVEATVARCEREHDRWTGWMYRASIGMLACFWAITVLAPLGAHVLVLSLLALAGVVLWAVESFVFREAVEWMFWLGKARRELSNHPDFDPLRGARATGSEERGAGS